MTNKKLILFPFILVAFEIATYLSNDMYLPALPSMMHELSFSYHEAQMTLAFWFFGSISLQLFLGPISDRYGRKPILLLGIFIFIASTILCAFATSIDTILIARFLQGTGICFISVPGYASIHESFDQKHAIRILALMASIAVLAPAFGPLLGGAILTMFNWRWIFGFLIAWGIITGLLLVFWMPETLPKNKRHTLEMGSLLMHYKNIITNFKFLKTGFAFGLLFCGFIVWISAGPFLAIDKFHYSPIMYGVFQTMVFMSYIIANYSIKYVMEWLGLQKMMRIGLFIALIGSTACLLLAYFLPESLLGMVFSLMVFSFGSGYAFAPLNRLTIETSDEPMGSRMAVFSTLVGLFCTLSSLLVGIFYNNSLLSVAMIVFSAMVLTVVAFL